MDKCKVCGHTIIETKESPFIIDHVPSETFYFTEGTICLKIVSCGHCGCVQLIDTPLSENYKEVYRSMGLSSRYRENKKNELKDFIKKHNLEDSDIIEIGCGDGQILEMLKEVDIDCTGLECGNINIEKCIDNGFKVLHGSIEDLQTQYDAFLSFYYLEHIPEPVKFVNNLFKILKVGGIGLIEVPNYDHIKRENLWLEFTKDHRLYFNKQSITYLLSHAGFEIESIKETTEGLCLSVVVKKNCKENFESYEKKIKNDETKFKNLVEDLDNDFSIFGAGHYSQLLINMMYSKYNIKPKYIFDSNKDKCNNKICGVEVLHKSEMKNKIDLKNIIIICGMYNDEVLKELIKMNKNLHWENILKWN